MANHDRALNCNPTANVFERPDPAAPQPRTLRSDDLFDGQRLVYIEHAGQQYRLLITRNDRLILQK